MNMKSLRLLISLIQIVALCLFNIPAYCQEAEAEEEHVASELEITIGTLGEKGDPSAITQITEYASDSDPDIRESVALSLGEIGVPEGVPILLKLAKDENKDVKSAAVWALGKIRDEGALPVLLELIDTKKAKATKDVIRSLGDIGSEKAIPALIEVVKNTSVGKTTRKDEQKAMQKRGRKKRTGRAFSWAKCRQEAILSLGRIGIKNEEVIQLLVECLKDEKSAIRRNASYSLCLLAPEQAVNALIEAVKKKDHTIQINLKFALRIIDTPEVVDKLINLFNTTKNRTVKLAAVEVMATMRNPSCYQFLLEAASDKNVYIRKAALEGLANLGNRDAVPTICEILKNDKNTHVRAKAAITLKEIRDPSSVQPLLYAFKNDKKKKVKLEALDALEHIGDKSIIPVLKEELKPKKSSTKTRQRQKGQRGTSGRPRRTEGRSIPRISKDVVDTIATIGGKETAPYILTLIDSKDSGIRRAAIEASYYVGGEEIINKLISIAENTKENTKERLSAIYSLRFLGPKEAIPVFIRLLDDNKTDIRNASIRSLGVLKSKEAVPNLVALLKDKKKKIVMTSAEALAEAEASEALPQVSEAVWKLKGNDRLCGLTYTAKLLGEDNKEERGRILQAYNTALKEEFSAASIVADIVVYAAIIAAAVLLGGGGGGGQASGTQNHYYWSGGGQAINPYPPPSNTMAEEVIPSNKSIGIVSALDEKDRANKALYSATGLHELKDEQSRVLLERALKSPYSEVRGGVALALGHLEDKRSFIPLIYYAQDMLAANRAVVALSLGKLGDPGAIPYIRLILVDALPSERRLAILGLEEIGGKECTALIKDALSKERHPNVRMEAAGALYKLTGEVPEELRKEILQNLGSHLDGIRLTALETCEKTEIKVPGDLLKRLAEEDPIFKIREKAIELQG